MAGRPVIIYLHGFTSSPQSEKARETAAWLAQHRPDIELQVPALSNYPDKAAAQAKALVESLAPRQPRLIGSSMGGFFSAWLSAQFKLYAALVNPGVFIEQRLRSYLGRNTNLYTGERFELNESHLHALAAMSQLQPDERKLLLLLQTGDETLDYRQALRRYPKARAVVETGGSHRFEGYINHLPDILQFFEL